MNHHWKSRPWNFSTKRDLEGQLCPCLRFLDAQWRRGRSRVESSNVLRAPREPVQKPQLQVLVRGPDRHALGLAPSRCVSGWRSEDTIKPARAGFFLAKWAQILHAFCLFGSAILLSLSLLSPVTRGSEGVWGECIVASKWGSALLGRGSALL